MKRSIAFFTALAGLAASARLALRHADDSRNESRLQARYGLSKDETKTLYQLARSEGFGYAAQRLLRDRRRASGEDEPGPTEP